MLDIYIYVYIYTYIYLFMIHLYMMYINLYICLIPVWMKPKPRVPWLHHLFTPTSSPQPGGLDLKSLRDASMMILLPLGGKKWVFPKIGVGPQLGLVKIMENSMYKWMIWVVFTHYFRKHPNSSRFILGTNMINWRKQFPEPESMM